MSSVVTYGRSDYVNFASNNLKDITESIKSCNSGAPHPAQRFLGISSSLFHDFRIALLEFSKPYTTTVPPEKVLKTFSKLRMAVPKKSKLTEALKKERTLETIPEEEGQPLKTKISRISIANSGGISGAPSHPIYFFDRKGFDKYMQELAEKSFPKELPKNIKVRNLDEELLPRAAEFNLLVPVVFVACIIATIYQEILPFFYAIADYFQ